MIDQYPYHVCMQYHGRYVKVQLTDGREYEGIIVRVDNDKVLIAIPEGREMPIGAERQRAFFGAPFFGYPGFFPGFGFRPFFFPYFGIRRIFPFPFFI